MTPIRDQIWLCPAGGSVRIAAVGNGWVRTKFYPNVVAYRWIKAVGMQHMDGPTTYMTLERFLKRFNPPVPAEATV